MGSLSLKFGCHILDCNINTRPIIVFGVELVYIIFLERKTPWNKIHVDMFLSWRPRIKRTRALWQLLEIQMFLETCVSVQSQW